VLQLRTSMAKSQISVIGFAVFLLAIAIRLALMVAGWPATDSDEGTMGLEALHIATRGEHPIFLYGQDYMGVGEAYLGALMFRVFGVSLLSLRLGMLILLTVFLLCTYLLARLLYGGWLAVLTAAVLALGGRDVMRPEILAVGGVAETLACGSLMFLLASWLAVSPRTQRPRQRWQRPLALFGWGLAAGIGLWSHLLIVPFVVASGGLLAYWCRRELRGGGALYLACGLVLGALPLIVYNLTVPVSRNTLAVFWRIHQASYPGAPTGMLLLAKQLTGTTLYSLPYALGMTQLCPLEHLPLYGRWQPDTLWCVALQGGWSLACLAALTVATVLAVRALFALRARRPGMTAAQDFDTQARALLSARLALLAAAWLTILAFALSATAAEKPWSMRYLTEQLIAMPALLWPIVRGLETAWARRAWLPLGGLSAALTLIVPVWGAGTIQSFSTIAAVRRGEQRETALGRDLLRKGIVHVHAGYWDCDRLIFSAQEQVLCGVIEPSLQPGLNRYEPYQSIVAADPAAAFLAPADSSLAEAFAGRFDHHGSPYVRLSMDGYIVYVPRSSH
jgi:hypothetical protein